MSDLIRKPLFNEHGDCEVGERHMINGNTTNLSDFNSMRYTWVSGWYRQTINNFWIPEEINLNQDVKDYRRLREAKKTIYDKTLPFLISLDSIQTASLPNVGEYITANEVNLYLTIQTFQEAVRSRSHSYMLGSICSSQERADTLYQWRNGERLLNRDKFVGDLYNDFQTHRDGRHLMKTMMASYILEGIYFYSGFVFLYNLGRMGEMPGSVQEIRHINRDKNAHLWLFRSMILGLQKRESQLFTEELTEEYKGVPHRGVEKKIRWGKYVIGNHAEGLTMEIVSDYAHYLEDLRSDFLGFGSLYDGFEDESKSTEWVSIYANADLIKTDFFEVRSSAYAKSGVLVDGL